MRQNMKAIRKSTVIGAFSNAPRTMGNAASASAASPSPDPLKFARILVPTDFSDPSKQALKCAARFAEQFGSRIMLIHVLEPIMSPDFTNFPLALDEDKVQEAARHRLLALAKVHLKEQFVEGALVRTGNPFHEISEAARERKIDLIIMATHGYTGVKRALLGSTAERVVRYAPCAVMTVR